MEKLLLNHVEVHSLEELREQATPQELAERFLEGTLGTWLEEHCYEREQAAVSALRLDEDTPLLRQRLCDILGVAYQTQGNLTPQEWAEVSRKAEVMVRYTQDPAILSQAYRTATCQEELAQLLEQGQTTIYLCAGPFSVPIRKGRVHYIGLGAPEVQGGYTQEQYAKAKITFEGVRLPDKGDEALEMIAQEAAKAQGYDDFAESHTLLATWFHQRMKRAYVTDLYSLREVDNKTSCRVYTDRAQADREAREVIEATYALANALFCPGSERCIVRDVARRYGESLQKAVGDVLARLAKLKALAGQEEELGQLSALVTQAETLLAEPLAQELSQGADYYKMYRKSYFLDRYQVEDVSDRDLTYTTGLLDSLTKLMAAGEYVVQDLGAVLGELQEDVNQHADTFFARAREIYLDHCARIEELAEELGRRLSEEDLARLEIEETAQSA